jgi:hypothetical protein
MDNTISLFESLIRSPIGSEFLKCGAGAVHGGPAGDVSPTMALAHVAKEHYHGLEKFRKALLGKSQPKPGQEVRIGDGSQRGVFLANVTDRLGYFNVNGFTILLPLEAVDVIDETTTLGASASVQLPGGRQGGFEGRPAALADASEKAWLASSEGQATMAKSMITRSSPPTAMGFFEKADMAGPRFERDSRIVHKPTGRKGKFVAAQSGSHSHVVLDDGSSLTCPTDELEADNEPVFAGHPDLPAFNADLPPVGGGGRRNLVEHGAKAAYYSSQQGQIRLAKLITPGASAHPPGGDSGAPGRLGINLGGTFAEAEEQFNKSWEAYVRAHPEADATPARLAKGAPFAVGARVWHPKTRKRGTVSAVNPRSVRVEHEDGSVGAYAADELEADSRDRMSRVGAPPMRKDWSRMEYGGYSNIRGRR